jgi:F-type H+-transporting ATPase subunit epsilon
VGKALRLLVLTPQRELLDTTVASVVAEGAFGQFGVLPEHVAFLSVLEPGVLEYRGTDGSAGRVAIKGGYAEVRDDVVTILADEAWRPGEIAPSSLAAARENAERQLLAHPFGDSEHEEALRELRWVEVLSRLAA